MTAFQILLCFSQVQTQARMRTATRVVAHSMIRQKTMKLKMLLTSTNYSARHSKVKARQ